jgi:hypothetical protein
MFTRLKATLMNATADALATGGGVKVEELLDLSLLVT